MIRVRKHTRQLASGKTATVRQHERAVTPQVDRDATWRDNQQEPPPPGSENDPEGTVYFRQDDQIMAVHPDGTVHLVEDEAAGPHEPAEPVSYFRDDDGRLYGAYADGSAEPMSLIELKEEMRTWRSLPEPEASPAEPMSPQKAKLLGCDTPEGLAKFNRMRAYREAGYSGPFDQDGQIADPDDPKNHESISALADLRDRPDPYFSGDSRPDAPLGLVQVTNIFGEFGDH